MKIAVNVNAHATMIMHWILSDEVLKRTLAYGRTLGKTSMKTPQRQDPRVDIPQVRVEGGKYHMKLVNMNKIDRSDLNRG